MAKAPLIILAGPSGSGKSTIVARLLKDSPRSLRLSVSATTRPPRPYEQNGVHYYFWTREQFEDQRQAGAFLEWAAVHGQWYGTLRSEVDEYRTRGIGVLLDIDVQGAAQVRAEVSRLSVYLPTDFFFGDLRATLEKTRRELPKALLAAWPRRGGNWNASTNSIM